MISTPTAEATAGRASKAIRSGCVQRKRLLIVGHSAFQGGAELCLDSLLRQLDRDKYQATVLFPWEGPMADSARSLGFDVVIRPLNWWMCWGFSFWYFKTLLLGTIPNIAWLVHLIRQNRIDLVYSNTGVIFEAAAAARLCRVPHVWHIHEVLKRGNVTAPTLPIWFFKKLIDWLSHKIIFESNASRSAYEGGLPDPKCSVVYNCVRFADNLATLDRAEARRHLDLGDHERVVTFVGRFSERKNPLLLVRAAARIGDRTKLRLVFVGDGPLREDLQETIRNLGLNNCCRVLPFQDDITWVLNATDVLVLPSRQESFGLVLVEAAALGKPAIATRTEGPSEIIVDGVTGFLISPDDEGELAERIIDVFGPNVDRQAMGQKAAQRARELFSASDYAKKIERVIDELLAKSPHTQGPSSTRSR